MKKRFGTHVGIGGGPGRFHATDDWGSAVLTNLSASSHEWLCRPGWNMMRESGIRPLRGLAAILGRQTNAGRRLAGASCRPCPASRRTCRTPRPTTGTSCSYTATT